MWPSGHEQVLKNTQCFVSSYPDVVSDAADGDNCVSGQKKVFSHFFSQSHRTKSIQITEDHLPLCPVRFTNIQNKNVTESIYFVFSNDHVIMQSEV